MEDLYKVLNVEKNASAEEIKKSYRNLAFKFHPDRNPGDKSAEENFKKINEAYSVLGDEIKRRQYDQYNMNGFSENFQQNGGFYQQQKLSVHLHLFFKKFREQKRLFCNRIFSKRNSNFVLLLGIYNSWQVELFARRFIFYRAGQRNKISCRKFKVDSCGITK